MFTVNGREYEIGGGSTNVTFSNGSVSVRADFGVSNSEKNRFREETVARIDVSGSARLKGTTVEGDVNAGGSVKAENAKIKGVVDAGGSITATSCTAQKFDAGGSITATSCTAQKFDAGGSVDISHCKQVGVVSAGGAAVVHKCPSVDNVLCGGELRLSDSVINKNVTVGSAAIVNKSKIEGKFSCAGDKLVIKDSVIKTIHFKRLQPMQNNSSFQAGNFSSTCSVTIDGVIGIVSNGVPLNVSMQERQGGGSAIEEKQKQQVIILCNTTVETIIFECENGVVMLEGESSVEGSIENGEIKK